MAFGDQLVVRAEPQPGDVRVRQESLDPAARVIAELEHRVDSVLRELEDVPLLEPRAGGQRLLRHVDRVTAVIVEDDKLRGAAGQKPVTGGSDVCLQRRLACRPVLGKAPEDLSHVAELRGALHVNAHRHQH